jgi:hypothetical protein
MRTYPTPGTRISLTKPNPKHEQPAVSSDTGRDDVSFPLMRKRVEETRYLPGFNNELHNELQEKRRVFPFLNFLIVFLRKR